MLQLMRDDADFWSQNKCGNRRLFLQGKNGSTLREELDIGIIEIRNNIVIFNFIVEI